MQVRPGFVLGLALIFVFAYFISLLMPSAGGPTKARIILTRLEEKDIASAMSQYASQIGGVTNIDAGFDSRALASTNFSSNKVITNANGEFLDFWDAPLQITTIAPTNFIIRSAGPGRKFGDKDDIVFNSAVNDFVQP